MAKRVIIIGTSPRKSGNSNRLAQEFERGAKDAGHYVETIYLYDKTINFCRGCYACQTLHKCVINDDANAITSKMREADVIVWATPVYYYCISGQMKTMIDRSYSLYATENNFREVYFLATAADIGDYTFQSTIKALEGWVSYQNDVEIKGMITVGGLSNVGAIEGHSALNEAYEMGKAV